MLVKLARVAKRPQVENTHFPCLVPYAGNSAPSPTQCSEHGLNHHQGCTCGSAHDSSCLPSTQNLLLLPYPPSRGRLGELQWLWKVTGTPAWSWMARREKQFPSFSQFVFWVLWLCFWSSFLLSSSSHSCCWTELSPDGGPSNSSLSVHAVMLKEGLHVLFKGSSATVLTLF